MSCSCPGKQTDLFTAKVSLDSLVRADRLGCPASTPPPHHFFSTYEPRDTVAAKAKTVGVFTRETTAHSPLY